ESALRRFAFHRTCCLLLNGKIETFFTHRDVPALNDFLNGQNSAVRPVVFWRHWSRRLESEVDEVFALTQVVEGWGLLRSHGDVSKFLVVTNRRNIKRLLVLLEFVAALDFRENLADSLFDRFICDLLHPSDFVFRRFGFPAISFDLAGRSKAQGSAR